MTIDDEIAVLKAKINSSQLKKIKAEAAKESAQEIFDTHMEKLRSLYEVDNMDQARAKLAELQSDLRSKMDQVTKILDDMKL